MLQAISLFIIVSRTQPPSLYINHSSRLTIFIYPLKSLGLIKIYPIALFWKDSEHLELHTSAFRSAFGITWHLSTPPQIQEFRQSSRWVLIFILE
jgi:hypothetical protein